MLWVVFWCGVVVGFLLGVTLIAVLAGNESPIERANDDDGSDRPERRKSRRVDIKRSGTGLNRTVGGYAGTIGPPPAGAATGTEETRRGPRGQSAGV